MNNFFKFLFFIFVLNINSLKAEIVKPSSNIKPEQVVKIQLKGLMKNDLNYKEPKDALCR